MLVNRCRHTLTNVTSVQPWRRCNLCLKSIIPFTTCKYCDSCECYLHMGCYQEMIRILELAFYDTEGTPEEKEGEGEGERTNNKNKKKEKKKAPKEEEEKEEQEQDSWFLSILEEQRKKFLKLIGQGDSTNSSNKNSNREGKATTTTTTKEKESSPSSPLPALFPAPKEECKVHELVKEEFFLPIRCAHCFCSLETAEQEKLLASCAEQSTEVNATTGSAPNNKMESGDEPANKSVGNHNSGKKENNDTVQPSMLLTDVNTPFLAFGTTGYQCRVCDMVLHCPCVACLPSSSEDNPPYRIIDSPAGGTKAKNSAPTKEEAVDSGEQLLRSLKELFDTKKKEIEEGEKDEMGSAEEKKESAQTTQEGDGEEKKSKEERDKEKENSSWFYTKAKYLLASYFTGNIREQNNSYSVLTMKIIIASVLEFMDEMVRRHPKLLLPSTYNNITAIQNLIRQQEALYYTNCEELEDAFFMKPTIEEKKGGKKSREPVNRNSFNATDDNQTLWTLRDIIRYAIAVYGDSSELIENKKKKDDDDEEDEEEEEDEQKAVERIIKERNTIKDRQVADILALPSKCILASHWPDNLIQIVLPNASKNNKAPSSASSAAAGEGTSERDYSPNEPNYVLCVDHISGNIVVSFRGTMSDSDILTDMCALPVPFLRKGDAVVGYAHQGLAESIEYLFNYRASVVEAREKKEEKEREEKSIRNTSKEGFPLPSRATADATAMEDGSGGSGSKRPSPRDRLIDTLLKAARDYPEYSIVITGHSLGGGLAVLFGVRLAWEGVLLEEDEENRYWIQDRVRVLAYAAMPTLSLPAAGLFDEKEIEERTTPRQNNNISIVNENSDFKRIQIWNVVNGYDMIPRLQVNSIDRLCRLLCDNNKESIPEEEEKEKETEGGKKNSTTSTMHKEEKEEKEETPQSMKDADGDYTVELYHPGRVFLLTNPYSTFKKDAAAAISSSASSFFGFGKGKEEEEDAKDEETSKKKDKSMTNDNNKNKEAKSQSASPTVVSYSSIPNRLVEVPRDHLLLRQMFLLKNMVDFHLTNNINRGLNNI